jgi:stage II sporulation protein D
LRRLLALAAGLGLIGATSVVSAPRWPASSGTIRVALVESTRAAEFRGIDIEVAETMVCNRCVRAAWREDTVRATARGTALEVDGHHAAGFWLRSEHAIRWNGRDYPGRLDLVRIGEGFAIVTEMPLEEYLAGVLRWEIGERWPLQALMAQAIAARTYAAYHRTTNAGKPYHIVASMAHQGYAGLVETTSPIWDAIRETAGQVLLWEGELFPAFYHTESGGFTEDPRTVFAVRGLPALKPVMCPFSAGSPHYYWSLDLRLTDLAELLRRADVAVGQVRAIEVAERTMSLRASTVTVHGTRSTVRLRGNDFRRIVGYDALKSTLFAVAVDGEVARFSGRGYGHGVGLCQWGAKGMAEQAYSARQILEYYYPGTTFSTLGALAEPR